MALNFYNAWIGVMSVPEKKLVCIYHVTNAWIRHYPEITDEQIKKDFKGYLYDLVHITHPDMFRMKLERFYIFLEQNQMQRFKAYFDKTYKPIAEQWAACYRIGSPVTTDNHMESLHR